MNNKDELINALIPLLTHPNSLNTVLRSIAPVNLNLEQPTIGRSLLENIAMSWSEAGPINHEMTIEYIDSFNKNEKSTQEIECWKQACISAAKLSTASRFKYNKGKEKCHENTFLALWKVSKQYLSEDERLDIGCEILIKKSWGKAAHTVITESTDIDWTNSNVAACVLEGDPSIEEHINSNNKSKITPILLAKNEPAFSALIQAGADINLAIGAITVKDIIAQRPTEWFQNIQQRSRCMKIMENQSPKIWTKETAWESVKNAKTKDDVKRILTSCKSEWPSWRGQYGESLVHRIAIHMPTALPMTIQRSECPPGIENELDTCGRDLTVWFTVGAQMDEQKTYKNFNKRLPSFGTFLLSQLKLPEMNRLRKCSSIPEANQLSILAFTLKAEAEFSKTITSEPKEQFCGYEYAYASSIYSSEKADERLKVTYFDQERTNVSRVNSINNTIKEIMQNGINGLSGKEFMKILNRSTGVSALSLLGEISSKSLSTGVFIFSDIFNKAPNILSEEFAKINIAKHLLDKTMDNHDFMLQNMQLINMTPTDLWNSFDQRQQQDYAKSGRKDEIARGFEKMKLSKLVTDQLSIHKKPQSQAL